MGLMKRFDTESVEVGPQSVLVEQLFHLIHGFGTNIEHGGNRGFIQDTALVMNSGSRTAVVATQHALTMTSVESR